MQTKTMRKGPRLQSLPKTPTGISGFDEITNGGVPTGRPTLICGTAGSGKTLFCTEFLVRGATVFGEPGVLMAFEETAEELAANVASLGFDLNGLVEKKLLSIDYVYIERSEIQETGDYDLDALFVRLDYAIRSVGARRVVIDTLEALFSSLPNEAVLRAELRRLFRWLKKRGVTALITAEAHGGLTRHGLEEYVSDCVIVFDHMVRNQLAVRRMRVVKYRGSAHGTNEYPFLIDEHGFSVFPISSLTLDYTAPKERVPTGVRLLDEMLGGKGYYRGSTVLITGTPGTGKSSLAAHFAMAAGRRGEHCLYFAMEESEDQIVRNMRSIGVDLSKLIARGLLRIHAARPTQHGLEMHLVSMYKAIAEFKPKAVIIDPITNLAMIGSPLEIKAMLTRIVDHLKQQSITGVFTALAESGSLAELTNVGISSTIDTWITLRDLESDGEKNRTLYIVKSRGMAHSNQVREFLLTGRGIEIVDIVVGPDGVLTGSAREAALTKDKFLGGRRKNDGERVRVGLQRKQRHVKAKIATLRGEYKEIVEQAQLEEREPNMHEREKRPSTLAARRGANHNSHNRRHNS